MTNCYCFKFLLLTAQWFFIVTCPDIWSKVFEEHRAVRTVVAPVVHFAAAKNISEKNLENPFEFLQFDTNDSKIVVFNLSMGSTGDPEPRKPQ
jgi:hypothetical protein